MAWIESWTLHFLSNMESFWVFDVKFQEVQMLFQPCQPCQAQSLFYTLPSRRFAPDSFAHVAGLSLKRRGSVWWESRWAFNFMWFLDFMPTKAPRGTQHWVASRKKQLEGLKYSSWFTQRATASLENRHLIEISLNIWRWFSKILSSTVALAATENTASPTGSWSAATVLLSSLQNCRVQSTTLSHRAAMGGLLSAFEDMFAGLFRKILKGCSVSIRILCVGLFIGWNQGKLHKW